MKNKVSISSDGICLYVNSRVVAQKAGLILLLVINVSLWVLFFWVMASPEEHSGVVKGKILLVLVALPVYIFTLGRYSAWNFWGEERIIINTKSVSYQNSYGIVVPGLSTRNFNKLSVGFNMTDNTVGYEKGEIILFDYDQNDLPVEIFSSSVSLEIKDLERIYEEVEKLFVREFYTENKFIPYSMN